MKRNLPMGKDYRYWNRMVNSSLEYRKEHEQEYIPFGVARRIVGADLHGWVRQRRAEELEYDDFLAGYGVVKPKCPPGRLMGSRDCEEFSTCESCRDFYSKYVAK